MQPCHGCGGMAVDAAYYCTRCRTYRGPVAQQVYPTYAPAPVPPGGRNPFLLPLIALCVALVIVAAGIVVVLVVKSSQREVALSSSRAAGQSSGPAAPVDPCLVGSWTVTTASQQFPVPGVGDVQLEARPGTQTTVIRPDGTAVDDYGGDSRYEGSSGGHTYTLDVTGTVRYSIRTANDTITFVAPRATGTVTLSLDGIRLTSVPLSVNSDPTRYTCSGRTLTEHTESYDVTLTRRS